MTRIGVLALQGDVSEHVAALSRVGAKPREVRRPEELEPLDGIVIPGGESTAIGRLATLYGLMEPLAKLIEEGLPAYGTCAGLILLASAVTEGEQPLLEALDVTVSRNAFGRQNDSFEASLDISGLREPLFPGVFIRAPGIVSHGPEVEVMADWVGRPVMVRSGRVMASAFHPELTGDDRVHQMFVDGVSGR